MADSDHTHLYAEALASILRRIVQATHHDSPEGVRELAVAANTLESARIVAMSAAEVSDFTRELALVEDPG